MSISGILNLHKPRNMTSHDCVVKIRRLFKTKKVGHTGTLDPDVNGVLPICIGKATKVVEYMTAQSKCYEGEVTIGFATTTEDRSGEVVATKFVEQNIQTSLIDEVLRQFEGEITQVPPMYSAVKVKGKRLYEYARAGQEIERPAREVTIHSLTRLNEPICENGKLSFKFQVDCSKGTYVRTLAVNIGEELGYPAHMSDLVRISSGPYQLKDSYTFEQLEALAAQDELMSCLVPFETALVDLPMITVDRVTEQKIKNGAVIPQGKQIEQNRFTVYNEDGECLAIYMTHPTKDGLMKPEKMFWTDPS